MVQALAVHARPAGSGSLTVTVDAAAVPVFVTVMVYPAVVPAGMVAASADLVTDSVVHCTVTVADACTDGAFAALAVAVFEYCAQLAVVVGAVTCAWN